MNDRSRNSDRSKTAALVAVAFLSLVADPSQSTEPFQGDREQGRRLFEAKGCIVCHAPTGKPKEIGPSLSALQRPQGLLELAGRLWNHAPSMQQLLAQQGKTWPTLSTKEMADLAAFFLAKPGADRPGSKTRGQVLLFKKGCLKCHTFFGEGAGVGPDLARFPHYGSPLEWATSVWDHAPKMRAKAEKLGTDYPRFEGDEMIDLVEFLKASAARNQGAP
jgi:mono/diheme cytochrome c family protein